MSVKGCAVCGGLVKPLDDQGVLGYCEGCGIVYAFKDRLEGSRGAREPARLGVGVTSDSKEADRDKGASGVEATTPAQAGGSYWRCPDCDTEIRSENDSDLGFAKREHIREYHPNRSTG